MHLALQNLQRHRLPATHQRLLSTLSTFRTQHLTSIRSQLSSLTRTHQTLSANHSHTLSQHNPTTHAAEILRLDTEKFKIAKQASDLEIEGERLASDLERLKLKLYRTLGIDVEADATTGEYNKAVIRNAAKGDVHVVNIDPKFSRHFYTNYFWRTM
ncbi:putative kinetochore protein spc24 [Neocucurbitaria cava]|uniref:Kinetochore protein Spc24 n=1 Tax=Neocucurbitaria cava TaxID=798079 RepID=A0A9W8Y0K6_9PLEO|nr:putative kinetochore protein spc24 [Neocucurbitaria cava]